MEPCWEVLEESDIKITRRGWSHIGVAWRRVISRLLGGDGTMLGWPGGRCFKFLKWYKLYEARM